MTLGSTRELHFRDERPPHQVKFALESAVSVLFKTTMEDNKLCMRAKGTIVGADYEFYLGFEAALPTVNHYSLTMDVTWGEQASPYSDYYVKTSGSWFELWTRDFLAANPPRADEGSSERYRQLCEEALGAERELDSVVAIQRAVIDAMKRGASFRTAHKEGGTNIYWRSGRFVRSDYGDFPDEQSFRDDAEFLTRLRQFLHGEVTQHSGRDQLSEIDTWRLITRRMQLP